MSKSAVINIMTLGGWRFKTFIQSPSVLLSICPFYLSVHSKVFVCVFIISGRMGIIAQRCGRSAFNIYLHQLSKSARSHLILTGSVCRTYECAALAPCIQGSDLHISLDYTKSKVAQLCWQGWRHVMKLSLTSSINYEFLGHNDVNNNSCIDAYNFVATCEPSDQSFQFVDEKEK